jgi:hypothetical protein
MPRFRFSHSITLPEIRREDGCLIGRHSSWTKLWVRPRLRQIAARIHCRLCGHHWHSFTTDDMHGPGEDIDGFFMPFTSRNSLPGEWGYRTCWRRCGTFESRWPEDEAPNLWKAKVR